MQIFITGGTGFIGNHLVNHLLQAGHQLTVLSRSAGKSSRAGLTSLKGDPVQPGGWQDIAAGHDAVINLAGASLFRPWTKQNKRLIRESRTLTTANIADALSREGTSTSVLLSASAIGYYGDRGNDELDEREPPGTDFLARIAADWEKEAEKCDSHGIRVVCCRFGVVLGPDGGAIPKMLTAFKLGLGSPLGSGEQWFSWIHIDDLINILSLLLGNKELSGAVNCTAPHPVTNSHFTKALAGALHRPSFLPGVPSFIIRTALGDISQIVLASQKAVPRVLQDHGYTWSFPDIESALKDIMNR